MKSNKSSSKVSLNKSLLNKQDEVACKNCLQSMQEKEELITEVEDLKRHIQKVIKEKDE